jgi:hypothetical protein
MCEMTPRSLSLATRAHNVRACSVWPRCAATLRSPPCRRPSEQLVEMSAMPSPWNDDEILARLAQARQAADGVPRDFIAAGKAAYSWCDIGAELAYDSALGEGHTPARVPAERAHLRALTFTSDALTIEIEITDDAILGQVVPLQTGEVEVNTPVGTAGAALIDDIGCFTVRPIPVGSFRLHCRTTDGMCTLTSWLML